MNQLNYPVGATGTPTQGSGTTKLSAINHDQ
jgi:hypothetical protein